MGLADEWQQRVVDAFPEDVTFLNPRRKDWDSSWDDNSPELDEQINWELENLAEADIIFMYFDPNTKAPITLLELGIHLEKRSNLVVCCPDGYWKKANVKSTSKRYASPVFNTFEEALKMLGEYIDYRIRFQ